MQCPDCTAVLPDEDLFCENCGLRLSDAAAVVAATPAAQTPCTCGAAVEEIDEEGFCLQCGKRVRRPASDHVEFSVSAEFAAVSDRGVKHDRNEDRCAIFGGPDGFAMVVCDGVSATKKSEVASAAVAEGVIAYLTAALADGNVADAETLVKQAIAAGEGNLSAQEGQAPGENAASTTVVAALVAGGWATIGWVGDSRAYWIDAGGAKTLTTDHSWLNQAVGNGEMSREQAERAPQAHAITRWIGADAGECSTPEMMRFAMETPGILLLCTDGLWNYFPTEEMMAGLVHDVQADGEEALEICRLLVGFANRLGGHDNITVAVLRCVPTEPAEA
jgi:serine/threonine protein phosphatase PrpC